MKRCFAALGALVLTAGALFAQTTPGKAKPAQKAPAAAARRSLLNPPSLNQRAPALFKAQFTTTKGVFLVQVTRAWAPLGADRFYNLVKNGYYDGASFFRVLPGFVAQFGINARPRVSKAWNSAKIKDDPVSHSNRRGSLTFATSGPNTRTTQLFINSSDNSRLDAMGFSPFGEVVEGMDVVDQFFSGYGEGAPQGNGPDQGRIESEGKAYLDKYFPQLDSVKSAVIEPQAPPAHLAKPAAQPTNPSARAPAKPAAPTAAKKKPA